LQAAVHATTAPVSRRSGIQTMSVPG
jgi:hypothetical protein